MQTESEAQAQSYELIVRNVSWLALAALLVTIPVGRPQTFPMLGLISIGAVYLLLRYHKGLMRQRWFASRITILLLNNLFIAAMLFVVGRTDMAYTGLIGLAVITAAFWYGLRGVLTVAIAQMLLLGVDTLYHPYTPLPNDPTRAVALAALILLILGYLVERLTRVQRIGRDTLEHLDTDRLIAETTVHELLGRYPDPAVLIGTDGTIGLTNPAFLELLPKDAKPAGQTIDKVLAPQSTDQHKTLDWSTLLTGESQRIEGYSLNINGKTKSLEINTVPISAGSHTEGYVVIIRDLSAQQSLIDQQASFFALASHELRTPLAQVEGALSLAIAPSSGLGDAYRGIVTKAHDSAMFMATLLQDLNTLFLSQNGGLDSEIKAVDPRHLIDQLDKDFANEASAKHLQLVMDILPNTPTVLTTEFHVLHILRNFVSNALKYTKEGKVIVRAEPTSEGGVKFSVQDTGKGISQHDKEKLFTQFFQAEDFATREQGGTGIGLYLSSQLAEHINARLWCDSKLGEGSVFYLEVPPLSQRAEDRGKTVEAGVDNLLSQI